MIILIKQNYDQLKKKIRFCLKNVDNINHLNYLNNQMKILLDTLDEINTNTFNLINQKEIDKLYKTFMPLILYSYILNDTTPNNNILNDNSFGSS